MPGTKLSRNDLCHCGSGVKYKKCCLRQDEGRRSDAALSVRSSNSSSADINPFGWTQAKLLRPGDQVTGACGGVSTVTSNRREEHPEGVMVYNLEIEGTHTFFVRAEGSDAEPVWVHNAGEGYRALSPEDAEALQAGNRIMPKGTSLGRDAILSHIQGNEKTGYISLSKTEAGTAKYDSGNGIVEIDVDIAQATGSTIVAHENVLQVARRYGTPLDVENVIAAQEFLIKGGIHPSAVIAIR